MDEASWWITPVTAVLTLLLGGGGVAAIMKARYDRSLGIATQEMSEDDALAARWEKIIEAQTKSLVDPLRVRLGEVETAQKQCAADLLAAERRYRSALTYIRMLTAWIRGRMTDADPPAPPADIAGDI